MHEDELNQFTDWMRNDAPRDYEFGTISTYRQYISQLERPVDPEADSVDDIVNLFEQAGSPNGKLSAFRKYLEFKKETSASDNLQEQKLDAAQTRLKELRN